MNVGVVPHEFSGIVDTGLHVFVQFDKLKDCK